MRDLAAELEPVVSRDGPASGQLLGGRYRLYEVRGRGGFAVVYRAHDIRLDTSVAVKLLDVPPDAAARRRFDLERRLGARMEHPNLIRIIDSGEHDGRPYAVMPLLQGRSLTRRLGCDWRRAAGWARQYLAGLRALHEARACALDEQRVRLLHRDIKPDNCFISDDGHLTILDLGLVKSLEAADPSVSSQLVGTPAYMAPECIAGEPASERSDVYSFGVTFFEMLTGKRPYHGGLLRLHALHVQLAPPPSPCDLRPDVPVALAALVQAMMAPLPADRPPTVAAALARLESVLRSCDRPETHEPPPAPTRRTTPPPGPRLWPTFALGLTAAALLLWLAVTSSGPASRVLDDDLRDLAAHATSEPPRSIARGEPKVRPAGKHDGPDVRSAAWFDGPDVRPAARIDDDGRPAARFDGPAAGPALAPAPSGSTGGPAAEFRPALVQKAARPPLPGPGSSVPPGARISVHTGPTSARRPPLRFAQAMERLAPHVRACARATGFTAAPHTVRVRFDPHTRKIDTTRVLKLAADHRFARCVDRIVRAAAPPPDDHHPNAEYTYFRRP